ncbi:MAG TPA: DUF1581 domain-containing protein, partial [Isosphaeraceae bacterium]|nr:DUF1581 domain-containing protein [Isosphaeraceae bacterium]
TAVKDLEALQKRLQTDRLQNSAELACHAGLPALALAETQAAAVALLEQAAKVLSGNTTDEPASSLLLALARYHIEGGRIDEARKQLEAYSAALERVASNPNYYGRDASYTLRLNALNAASAYARFGMWPEALDLLGQLAGMPLPRYNYGGQMQAAQPLTSVARQLAKRPAQERFDRLKAWTFPAAKGERVRVLAALASQEAPPDAFGSFSLAGLDAGVVSTSAMLINAAREVSALDALADLARRAADEKRPNADAVRALVEIARGHPTEAEPYLKDLLERWSKTVETPSPDRVPPPPEDHWPEFLVVRACLAEPHLATLGRKLAAKMPALGGGNDFTSQLARDVATSALPEDAKSRVVSAGDPGLAHFTPFSQRVAAMQSGALPGWWAAHSGHVVRKSGSYADGLVLNYPLTGRFEATVESFGGNPAIGYSGAVIEPLLGGPRRQYNGVGWTEAYPGHIAALGGGDMLSRSSPYVTPEGYNRLTMQVEPGKVRYLVNGHLFHEDSRPGSASPWLFLMSPAGEADFRRLAIRGTPEIPREVRLFDADRFDGWIASFYNETLPKRFSGASAEGSVLASLSESQDLDWWARAGELHGRRLETPGPEGGVSSRLYYHRPLLPGETLAYE